MDEDEEYGPKKKVYFLPTATPLMVFNTQMALLTGWHLVWQECKCHGWQLRAVPFTEEIL